MYASELNCCVKGGYTESPWSIARHNYPFHNNSIKQTNFHQNAHNLKGLSYKKC